MAEADGGDSISDLLTAHVLEFEADAAAANFSLKIACDMKGNAWRITDAARPFLTTFEQRYSAWLFSVFTLFIIVERANELIGAKSRKPSTHPSPILMRAFFTMLIFARQGPFNKPEAAITYGASVLDAVHRGIRAVTDEALTTNFGLDLVAPSRNAHMRALGEQWQRMYPELQRLGAKTGTQPTPIDLIDSFITS
jgi:hypothetical protein